MPKFLDPPSWYATDGTLMSLPSDAPSQYLSTLKTNSDGATKWEKPAVDSCNQSVNGGAMIYAPILQGTEGQVLVSSKNGVVPGWEDKFKKVIDINSALNATSTTILKATSSADVLGHLLFLGIRVFGAAYGNLLFPIGYATTSLQNIRFPIIMPLSSGTASTLYISCWNALFCPVSTSYSGLEIANIWGGTFTFSSNPSWTPGAPAGLYFDAIYSL